MTGKTSTNYFKGLSRKEYIQKAHDIIREEGIGAVSIRRIAKELGCSSASLYRYFSDLSELLYFAELRTLKTYIDRLARMERMHKNTWEIYVGVWDCYAREAFAHPEAYDLLFFSCTGANLKSSIEEYYQMFPEDINDSSSIFREMLKTPDFMQRDYQMCRKCVEDDAITDENAVLLNRMVCMLYKGYFKSVLDGSVKEEGIEETVRHFLDDVDVIVKSLASDLKGYKGYQ